MRYATAPAFLFFFLSLIFWCTGPCSADSQLMLNRDTRMQTPGPAVTFKGKTSVTLNSMNQVIQGTLAYNNKLAYPAHPAGITFKAGYPVMFNNKGQVTMGTLRYNNKLAYPAHTAGITFKAGYPVMFNNKGQVTRGTLRYRTMLTIPGGAGRSSLTFKAGTPVAFNEKGQVTEGTLYSDTKCCLTGRVDIVRAGTPIRINNDGVATIQGFYSVLPSPSPPAEDLAGKWILNGNGSRGVIDFQKKTMDYDSPGYAEEKITDITFDTSTGKIRFLRPGAKQVYTGTLQGGTIKGTFTWEGGTYPWDAHRE